LSPETRAARWLSIFDDAARARLALPGLAATATLGASPGIAASEHDAGALGGAASVLAAAFAGEPLHPVEAAMRADLRLYLPGDVLAKVDVASMAHGLEVRTPLLDHRVVELVARLPLDAKLDPLG